MKERNELLCQCAGCKALRDEHGQWIRFDPPLITLDDLEVRVTHGLCPSCAEDALDDD